MPTAFEEIILGLIQQIAGEQAQAQLAATLNAILAGVNGALVLLRQIVGDLVDPVTGLAAIEARLATFQATTAIDVTAILTAIAATQQAANPIVLPSTFPAGWDAGMQANAQAGVLTPNLPGTTSSAGDFLRYAGAYAMRRMDIALLDGIEDIYVIADYGAADNVTATFATPFWFVPDILPDDTLLTFVTRENPGQTILQPYGDGGPVFVTAGTGSEEINTWQTVMNEAQFRALRETIFGATIATAPVWPGLASVTLGTPVALSDGLFLNGPLSGVIVEVTSVPSPISFYPFGAIKSYVRGGAIVFTTDNGDSEFPQPFGPDNQVILPKSMTSADGATVRLPSGIVGTITPFTIA